MTHLQGPEAELDLIKEVGHIGMGRAASALGRIMGQTVRLEVPSARRIPFSEVPEALGGAETLVTGTHFGIRGDLHGNILVVLPEESSLNVLDRLVGRAQVPRDLPSIGVVEKSAIMEVGNILASAYVGAIGTLINRPLLITVPGLSVDMAGAVVDTLLVEISQVADTAQVVETAFYADNMPLRGAIYLLPAPDTSHHVLTCLGMA